MKNLVRNYIPAFIRSKLNDRRLKKQEAARLNAIASDVVRYYATLPADAVSREVREAVSYIEKHGACVFPYPFEQKYKPANVKVFLDGDNGLRYVIQEGKRLYFRRDWCEQRIKLSYACLEMEQDPLSPHRYITNDFRIDDGDTFADVGAAEGNLSLSIIEKAKQVYLFEADEQWMEPLRATFKPWESKVQIINKYVSDQCDDENVTLDSFFADKGPVDCIKIDIEGYERLLLKGYKQTLDSGCALKLAICTYHQQQDEVEFQKVLLEKGFQTQTSDRYMLFIYGEPLKPPYFRRGLIRAWRTSSP
jgi:hypothetical protein